MDVVSCIIAYEKLSREVFQISPIFGQLKSTYSWVRGRGWFSASALEKAVVEILEYRLPLAESRLLKDDYKVAKLNGDQSDTKMFF